MDTALKPAVILYREEQFFAVWVYLLLSFLGLKILFPELFETWEFGNLRLSSDPSAYVVFFILAMLTACFMKMTTELDHQALTVSFGWLPLFRKSIPISFIESLEPSDYRPLIETLGWGIRRNWRGENVLSARGNRAVKLLCKDGSVYLIGSQKPEELAGAIEAARRSLMM